LPPRRNVSLIVAILAVTFSLRAAETGVPNFRWGDTAAAHAIGGRNHFSADLLFLVLRVEPHLIVWVHARINCQTY